MTTGGSGFLTKEEAAAILAVSPRTVDRWRAKTMGPAYYRFGRPTVRYSVDDLRKWAERKLAEDETP